MKTGCVQAIIYVSLNETHDQFANCQRVSATGLQKNRAPRNCDNWIEDFYFGKCNYRAGDLNTFFHTSCNKWGSQHPPLCGCWVLAQSSPSAVWWVTTCWKLNATTTEKMTQCCTDLGIHLTNWDLWVKGWIKLILRALLQRELITELTRCWTRIPKQLRLDYSLSQFWLFVRCAALKLLERLLSKSDGELCIQRFYFGLCGKRFCFFFFVWYLNLYCRCSDWAVITTNICDWKEQTNTAFSFLFYAECVMKKWWNNESPFLKVRVPEGKHYRLCFRRMAG